MSSKLYKRGDVMNVVQFWLIVAIVSIILVVFVQENWIRDAIFIFLLCVQCSIAEEIREKINHKNNER